MSGNGQMKARKPYQVDLQKVGLHGAGMHFFGQFELEFEADEAVDQRRRKIKYEAFFARDAAQRAAMVAKGFRKDYIFDADPTIDTDAQRRKWAPVFMALLIDRWERYHLNRGDDVAWWPEVTPPGKWPPMPPLVEEWTAASNGGGDENPYVEWVKENVVLCGSRGAACTGWSNGEWKCQHFLTFSDQITKAMKKGEDQKLFGRGAGSRGVAGAVKTFEEATGRHHIPKLSETERKRAGAHTRHNKVFPAMQLRSELPTEGDEGGGGQ